MRVEQLDPKFMPFYVSEDADEKLVQLPAGWELATRFQQYQQALPTARARREAERRAIAAVLRRARDLLRHASRPRRVRHGTWPSAGELDLDRTIEDLPVRPQGLKVERTEPAEVPTVAMLDMSLSMTGEKIALVAVAAAILRLALERVGIVAFDTSAHRLVRLEEAVAPRDLVRRVLSYPAHGYTNIGAGLEAGLVDLRQAKQREKVGILLTDGVGNVGWDPVAVARKFPKLHVVQLGKPSPKGSKACRDMARAGKGEVWTAEEWADLPKTVRELVREVFRR